MTIAHARLVAPQELTSFEPVAVWPSLSAEDIGAHAPDASLVVTESGAMRARCSLWWRSTPPFGAERLGVIGHYAAASVEDGRSILDAAATELARQGCTLAVGPMDGNTWRRYRLVVDRGTEPPFFMEPTNPEDWPSHYEAAGFTPIAHYFSALNTNLSVRDERMGEVAERLDKVGVRLRTLDLGRFEQELKRIYWVAEISFAKAFLYTRLPESVFAAQYQRIRQFVRPELVLLAEHEDGLVGFAFNIPDVLELGSGGRPRTAIIKTLAVLPDRTYAGLGSLLTDRSHAAAAALGYTRMIHALMHESNRSRQISAHTGQPMRRYALFQRPLVTK